ncbi:helix-turn-helix domain-containing protein [Photobacterium leiognathi]|uniref:helix-turn-helix domain-containing protein n=1 Tax=Photobacterium leiognathi TaxID=553611 RepID=UPI0011B29EFC|nr:helix-turn-helix transcriptional regulator [Photobacterium leiognathi]
MDKISHLDDSRHWDVFFEKELRFKSKSSFLNNANNNSNITSFLCNDDSKVVLVDSDPYVGNLNFLDKKSNTIFIVSSLSKLDHVNNSCTLSSENGSSKILSSDDVFNEVSNLRRKSASIILNTSNYIEDNDDLEQILWRSSNDLSYGYLIDKLMNDLYSATNARSIEKIKNAIGVTISLSIDDKMSGLIKRNGLFDQILYIIDNNYKNNNFSLQDLSDKVGVSTKTIQNILSKYSVKFYSYMQSKRCENFKFLISTNKKYNLEYLAVCSGFKNLSAADREFRKKYNCSIRDYLKKAS